MTSPSVPEIGRVVVDPRFRARRIAVRKHAGRRRLRRLVLLIAFAFVALAAVVVLESPVLDVDEVAVVGNRTLDAETVRKASGVGIGAPLLLADLDGAARSIEENPWVDDAVVSRDLPNRVTVEIHERTPSARFSVGDRTALVDADGHVLVSGDAGTVDDVVSPGAPFVSVIVPEAAEAVVPEPGETVDRAFLDAVVLAERLRDNPAGAVAAVHLEPSWWLELAAGGRATLGDASDLDLKIEALRTVLARVDLTCLDTIDLRVPTHPVVTRNPAC